MGQLCCFPFAREEGKICKYRLRLAEAAVLAFNVEVALGLALGFPRGNQQENELWFSNVYIMQL